MNGYIFGTRQVLDLSQRTIGSSWSKRGRWQKIDNPHSNGWSWRAALESAFGCSSNFELLISTSRCSAQTEDFVIYFYFFVCNGLRKSFLLRRPYVELHPPYLSVVWLNLFYLPTIFSPFKFVLPPAYLFYKRVCVRSAYTVHNDSHNFFYLSPMIIRGGVFRMHRAHTFFAPPPSCSVEETIFLRAHCIHYSFHRPSLPRTAYVCVRVFFLFLFFKHSALRFWVSSSFHMT